MKPFPNLLSLTILAFLSWALAGCGGPPKTKMDTTGLVAAFASAEASLKSAVEAAAKQLDSGKLKDGTASLAALVKKSHESLTEPQKTALVDVVTKIQLIMSEDGDKVDMDTYQAADDIIAGMEGKEAPKVGINPDAVRPPQPAAE